MVTSNGTRRAHTYTASNDAVENLCSQWNASWEQIDSVPVETYAGAAVFDNDEPVNDLAARFSVPYTVAVALVSGHLASIHRAGEVVGEFEAKTSNSVGVFRGPGVCPSSGHVGSPAR